MILKTLGAVAIALSLMTGIAAAAPSVYPQTWSQIAHDLSNPHNPTYAPTNQ